MQSPRVISLLKQIQFSTSACYITHHTARVQSAAQSHSSCSLDFTFLYRSAAAKLTILSACTLCVRAKAAPLRQRGRKNETLPLHGARIYNIFILTERRARMLMKNHEPFSLCAAAVCAQTGGGWKASPHSIRRGSHPRALATLDSTLCPPPVNANSSNQQVRAALPGRSAG
jgi:hypothetical protein